MKKLFSLIIFFFWLAAGNAQSIVTEGELTQKQHDYYLQPTQRNGVGIKRSLRVSTLKDYIRNSIQISDIQGFSGIQTQINSKFDASNTIFESPLTFIQLTNPSTGAISNSIGIPQSSQFGNGYLSSSDWITFNAKAGLATNNDFTGNNNFTGSNKFLTPIFANSTSTSAYSSITGVWSNTGNLGVFSFRYNTRAAGNTVTWNPIRMDYNGWVGIGTDPTQAFEVLGASKFNSPITATSIAASGGVSAQSFISTTGASFGTSSGNVGIGTGSASQKLSVLVSTGTEIPNAGLAGGHQILSNGAYGMMFGVNNVGNGWIQTGRTDAVATNYNLLLNPNGGNIGVGTQTPLSNLHVNGTGNSQIRLTSNTVNSVSMMIWNAQTESYIGNFSNHDFYIRTNNINRAVFTANGNFGIGTNLPNSPLQFSNNVEDRKITLYETGNNIHQIIGLGLTANGHFKFQTSATTVDYVFNSATSSTASNELFRIKGTGNIGIGTQMPLSKLHVSNGNIETDNSANGLILKSPDGTRYLLKVANGGTLTVTAL